MCDFKLCYKKAHILIRLYFKFQLANNIFVPIKFSYQSGIDLYNQSLLLL